MSLRMAISRKRNFTTVKPTLENPMNMKTTIHPASLAGLIFASLLAPLSATTLDFDFTRGTGDRAHYFGTNQSNGNFDNLSSLTGWYVQTNAFKSPNINGGSNPSTYWAIVNDAEPDTVNATIPDGSEAFEVSSSSALTLRTTLTSLSSGDGGVPSYGGFVFGLDDSSSTGSGLLAVVSRTPGSNSASRINFYTFLDGQMGGLITQSSTFTYDGSSALYLDLQVAGSGSYSFGAFSDAAMTVSLASISGSSLSGYSSGYAGLFFHETGGANVGAANMTSFYMEFTPVPEPSTIALFAAAVTGLVILRRRASRN